MNPSQATAGSVQLTVDGKPVAAVPGATLLDALRGAGCNVPQLCHDDRLAPHGACRMCVVEVEGEARPVASCTASVCDGMVVRTRTPALESLRSTNLGLMTEGYPVAAIARDPQHPFHRLLAEYGIKPAPAQESAPLPFRDDSHPYLGVDMDRCIQCHRCVRICDDVQGQFVWGIQGRGESARIAPRRGSTLIEAGCVACGACADTSPTGALFDKRADFRGATQWTRTTCVYCAVGCQMAVGTRDDHVVQVRPDADPVNRGHLCVKGRYAHEFVDAPDRVTQPMIKRDGRWATVSWDQALDHTAERLRELAATHGPDAIGVLGSARATNEENYLIQKLARVALGTNNVDCCARVCHTPTARAMKDMLGTGAATNSFDDIERASLILLVGCNPTENHPVVGARIKQAVLRGARLIVIDPRRIELTDYADIHLAVRPGHNVALLNALASAIIEEQLTDREFLARRVDGYAEYARSMLADYAPEAVAAGCGVPAADIRAAARLYATTRPAMCFHGLGVTEHLQGTEGVMCVVNLALLTGNLGKPGSGANPLRGQNNVQGAAHMGCDPATLPGGQSFADAGERIGAAWGAPLPESRGMNLMQMMDAAAVGSLRALWAFGYDVYLSLANATATRAALGRLDFVIIQDLFMNETAREFGGVFLPAASFLERDGTFMNSDRRVQRVRRALSPRGDSRPDWWIIREIARRIAGEGAGFDFEGPEAIWNEVRSLWPAGAGLSYARIDSASPHWPCPTEDHPGTPILHTERFTIGERAALRNIPWIATTERCDEDFPFLMTSGRTLYQFNAGTLTGRTPNAELRPSDTLDMAPADVTRLGVSAGECVRVKSRHGEAVLPVRPSSAVREGQLFATFHTPEIFLNRITSPVRDRLVGAPEYKVTAVRVERLVD